VRFVEYRSTAYFTALATSKYLVNNATFPQEFAKRPDQVYLNTWHGVALKHMGFDMPGGGPGSRNITRNLLNADYLVSANSFMTESMYGDGFVQRSSYNDNLTGGLNLSSTVAVGGQKAAFTGLPHGRGAGMIVDVDTDLDGVVLRADDLTGGSTTLHPGRNFVPITAYRNSLVTFDFEGVHPPAANIEPSRTRYHLNKGGVDYRKISVMKTVTVLGRLLDEQGQPLKGHHVINHASRGISEVDGFFSMEMNAASPTLEVRYGNELFCRFRLDPDNASVEGDVLMIGDLRCTPDTLADTTGAESDKAKQRS